MDSLQGHRLSSLSKDLVAGANWGGGCLGSHSNRLRMAPIHKVVFPEFKALSDGSINGTSQEENLFGAAPRVDPRSRTATPSSGSSSSGPALSPLSGRRVVANADVP